MSVRAMGFLVSVAVTSSLLVAAAATPPPPAAASDPSGQGPGVDVPDPRPSRLDPGNLRGSLTVQQIRELVEAGKAPDITNRSGPLVPPGDPDVNEGGDNVPAARGTQSGGAQVGARSVSYSVDGTIYDVGQGTSEPLPGPIDNAALADDGSSAIVEYADPQWASAIFLGAPWQRNTIGVKSLSSGYAAPLSFDVDGRPVPARLEAVSPNGRWVAFTGPNLDLMYADPENLGKLYLFDAVSLDVTEIPLERLGRANELSIIPNVTSVTDDGTRFTWGSCVAVVGGDMCAYSFPGSAMISGDGSKVLYRAASGHLYQSGSSGGTGTLVSKDTNGNAVVAYSWVQSWDGSVVAYTSVENRAGTEYEFSYYSDNGQVTNFLSFSYWAVVQHISGDGNIIAFSHPYGVDSSGFMTMSSTAWDRRTESFLSFAIGADNQVQPNSQTVSSFGLSADGSRVGLQSQVATYVYDQAGRVPDELMARVPGTGAFGYNYDAWAADPVNTRTGALQLAVTDIALPSRGLPAVMTRTYSSDLTHSSRLGAGWFDTFASTVEETEPGAVTVLAPDGALLDFVEDDDRWSVTATVHATLEQTQDGWTLTAQDGTTFSYGQDGRLEGAATPDGQGWSVTWQGSTQTVTTTAGASLTLAESGGLLRTASLPGGQQIEYDYTDGLLTSVTDAAGGVTEYTYDGQGRMTGSTDAAGNVQFVNTYDEGGRLATQADATGAETTFSWVEDDELSVVEGPGGDVWLYLYRGPALVWSEDPEGVATYYVYDQALNIVSVESAGRRTTIDYDESGQPVEAHWPDGTSLQVELDSHGQPLTVTDAGGTATTYVYDSRGHLVETHLPDGRVATNTWDPVTGTQTASTTPGGRTTLIEHSTAGLVTQVTSPEGRVAEFAHDVLGRLTSYTAPHASTEPARGHTWDIEYSADGRDATVTDPLGGERVVEHNALGGLEEVTDTLGNATGFTYTDAQELESVVDALAGTTSYSWDSYGWLAGREDQNGNAQTYEHDALGRLRTLSEPDGARWSFTYDKGSLTQVKDPNAEDNPTAGTTAYSYDSRGRLAYQTPATPGPGGGGGGGASRAGRSALSAEGDHSPEGEVIGAYEDPTIEGPDGRLGGLLVTGWVVDDDRGQTGIKVRVTVDGDTRSAVVGEVFEDDYFEIPLPLDPGTHEVCVTAINVGEGSDTELGCVSAEVHPQPYLPSAATPFAVRRDTAGRVEALGVWDDDLEEQVDAVAYTWDTAGRLTAVTRDGHTVTYGWDADDRLVSLADANGATVTRTYTDDGLLASVTSAQGTTSYDYDEAGNQVLAEFPDGTVEQRSFDTLGRTTRIELRDATAVLDTVSYEYDLEGNPVRIDQGGVEHRAVYDARNQLTDWCEQDPCGPGTAGLHYTYDPTGNRLTETRDGATTTYTYDTRNRLTAVSAPDASVRVMAYDSAGRLIRDGDRAYQYDVRGRLTSVTDPGGEVTTYAYTVDGLLAEKTSGGSTTQFAWDTLSGAPQLLSEQVDGTTTMTYVHGQGLVSAVGDATETWVHTDRLGSTTSLTADGDVVGSATYDPFGQLADSSGLVSSAAFPLFAGTPADRSTGLLLMGARAYDPTVGRFLTFDPAPVSADDPAISTYVYVNNRPTALTDPTGLRGAVVDVCKGAICTVYALDDIAGRASDAFGLATAGSAVLSFFVPPAAVAVPMFGTAAAVSGLSQIGTGLAITGHDAVLGGDWACEAGHVGGSILGTFTVGTAADAAWSGLGSTRAAKLALYRATDASMQVGVGNVFDGLVGSCSRPGY